MIAPAGYRYCVLLAAFSLLPAAILGQDREPANQKAQPLASRIGVAAGMGVNYADVPDVVDVVNSLVYTDERVAQFRAGVEFFFVAVMPVSDRLAVKLDYAYFLLSYDATTPYGPGSFTVQAHLPTLLLQYTFIDAGLYNVKAGGGLGYHVGSLTEQYGTVDDRFTGHGIGTMLDAEANTAFGDHLFAYLGGTLRWDFIGSLTSPSGKSAAASANASAPMLRFFSIGARLGMSYYF